VPPALWQKFGVALTSWIFPILAITMNQGRDEARSTDKEIRAAPSISPVGMESENRILADMLSTHSCRRGLYNVLGDREASPVHRLARARHIDAVEPLKDTSWSA